MLLQTEMTGPFQNHTQKEHDPVAIILSIFTFLYLPWALINSHTVIKCIIPPFHQSQRTSVQTYTTKCPAPRKGARRTHWQAGVKGLLMLSSLL